MITKVHLGCGIDGLWSLPERSVALVLSDLPSGETRAAFDEKADLQRLKPAIDHALKPNGVAILMASSFDFAVEVRQVMGKALDIVWEKSMGTGHLNTSYRPLKTHEFIMVFVRAGHVYHPQMTDGASPIHAARRTSHGENYGPHSRITESRAGATNRFPTTVLHFASVGTTAPERVHPQQKPVPLMLNLIETYTDPGELVCDPYAGSGSTGVAATKAGRRFIGYDTSPRFAPSVVSTG